MNGWVKEWMDEMMHGWNDGWVELWMDGMMNG